MIFLDGSGEHVLAMRSTTIQVNIIINDFLNTVHVGPRNICAPM